MGSNFVRVYGDYLVSEVILIQSIGTWPLHIDHFEWKYYKAFAVNPLFVKTKVDFIHTRVQVFLHLFNVAWLGNVETGALSEFGNIQHHVGRGECIKSTPVWVEFPTAK